MLSEKEIQFLQYWESVRETESMFMRKLIAGLPMAALFGLPIVLSIAVIYFLSPDWFTKISQMAAGSATPILLAVFLFIVSFGYMRKHFKWEMNEQLYQELRKRQQADDAANS